MACGYSLRHKAHNTYTANVFSDGIVMAIQTLIISFGRHKSFEIHMIRKMAKKDREVSKLIIKRPNDESGRTQFETFLWT